MQTRTMTAPLGGSVTVDRNWARALGVDQLAGAQRVGRFYRIPRAQLRRLEAVSPTLKWTAEDDRAVAALVESELQPEPATDGCLDCTG